MGGRQEVAVAGGPTWGPKGGQIHENMWNYVDDMTMMMIAMMMAILTEYSDLSKILAC